MTVGISSFGIRPTPEVQVMNEMTLSGALALLALGLSAIGMWARLRLLFARPLKPDRSVPKGSRARGILYAFTLGMAPWEKESTRRHWFAYMRGVVYHMGVFAAFPVLLASPWLRQIPEPIRIGFLALTGLGTLSGIAGLAMRWIEPNLRALSTPDDYASIVVVTAFVAAAMGAVWQVAMLPLFYVVASTMLVYLPFSKVRHCFYFFFSRFYFGAFFGHRGVLGQTKARGG